MDHETIESTSVAFIAIMGMCLALAVLGNIGVIVVVCRNKKLRTVTTNIFICNLALSDIFLAAVVLPQNIHDISHTKEFHEGLIACKLVNSLPVFCITCSIYCMVAISWERLRAIVYHTRHQLSTTHAKLICLAIWAFAVVLALPTLIEYEVIAFNITSISPESSHGTNDGDSSTPVMVTSDTGISHDLTITERVTLLQKECGSDRSLAFAVTNSILLLIVAYLFPTVVMMVNYSCVTLFIIKKSKTELPENSGNLTLHKHKVRIIKMLVIAAAVFIICWMPYFILLLMQKLTHNDGTSHASGTVNTLRIGFSVVSVLYNPLLYARYNTSIREGFKELLCCHPICRKKKVAPTSGHGHTERHSNAATKSACTVRTMREPNQSGHMLSPLYNGGCQGNSGLRVDSITNSQ